MDYGVQINPNPPPTGQVLHRLLSQAFAHMEGRVDPPSSMALLDAQKIADAPLGQDLVVARSGDRVVGCLFGEREGENYCLQKIAVVHSFRQQGVARAMIDAAAGHAGALGLSALTLQSRIELTENHAAFNAMGFRQTGTFTHPGYDEPTSLVFTRPLSPARTLS